MGRVLRWALALLPAYVLFQAVPLPLAVVPALSPALADARCAGAGGGENQLRFAERLTHEDFSAIPAGLRVRRLFSQISRNWAAEPLADYGKILISLIRGTTTAAGLKVRAYLDTKEYPLKVKPSAQRLRALRITRYTILPKWNYAIVAPSNGK
jgi:hypothetical protein